MNPVDTKYLEAWKSCKVRFQKQIPRDEYIRWIEPLYVYSFDKGVLFLAVPNSSHASYIESNFISVIRPIIIEEFNGVVQKMKYFLEDKIKDGDKNLATIDNYLTKSPNKSTNPLIAPGVKKLEFDPQLNFDYTFDNFVVGDCNKLAHAAGVSVAERPGEVFNPMFIYGDSGLGKTHIAQAVGIEVKKQFPAKNVLYVSTQRFVDQFTTASMNHDVNAFVKFYQMMDLLIIDDIQELAGKPQTQIVFFNIFNHLHQNKKQLIFTSDKSPVELKDIENRLISRFKWALSVQLSAPDFETKVAIIKSKSKRHNVELSQEVIEYLANNIHTNVRELEGAVSSFAAHSSLLNIPASIDLARNILSSYVAQNKKEVTVEYIQEVVCEHYKISKDTFLSSTRVREVALARQVAMYLSKEYTGLSLKQIGASIGGKSHSTVVHSCSAIENLIETDKEFKKHVEQLKNQLR